MYLVYSDSFARLVELSEGRLVVPDMPAPRQQDIAANVYVALRAWAAERGGKAFIAPGPVRLWPNKFREPDVILYAAEHLDRIGDQYGGPPDLVVEAPAPGTAELDVHVKRAENAQAGIPEYWTIDTEQISFEHYVLANGRYRLLARHGAGSLLKAATLPDLLVSLDALYSDG